MKAQARALPRRRKPSLATRIRPFWILAIVLAIGAGFGGAWLAQSPWFRVAHVAADVPLDSPVSAAEVRAAAAIPAGANVWLLNTGAIARRIEAIPYVDRASVRRGQFPKPYVDLAITVRRPTACVRAGDRSVTIDATERVLQAGCALAAASAIDAGAAAMLPSPGSRIGDPAIARLLADARVLADDSVAVRLVRHDRWGGVEAVDVTGVTLRFGDDGDLEKKAKLVAPVRLGIGTRRAVSAIDLRSPATPIVEFR